VPDPDALFRVHVSFSGSMFPFRFHSGPSIAPTRLPHLAILAESRARKWSTQCARSHVRAPRLHLSPLSYVASFQHIVFEIASHILAACSSRRQHTHVIGWLPVCGYGVGLERT
jgi:hypothetical protein